MTYNLRAGDPDPLYGSFPLPIPPSEVVGPFYVEVHPYDRGGFGWFVYGAQRGCLHASDPEYATCSEAHAAGTAWLAVCAPFSLAAECAGIVSEMEGTA